MDACGNLRTSIRLLLCLTLVALILTNHNRQVSAVAQDEVDTSGRSSKLLSIEKEVSSAIDLSASPDEEISNSLDGAEESEEAPDDQHQENQGAEPSKKFTWEYHQEDHGHYAGRSLLSEASFDSRTKPKSEEEETSDEIEISKSQGNLKALNRELDPLETVDFAEKEWQLMFRSFDMAYDSMSSSIIQELGRQTNLFEQVLSRLKPQCRRDINHIRASLQKHKLWALRMLDSNGKLPSGVTYGRFSSPGDYEECLGVQVDETIYTDVARNLTEKYKFHGKYCLLDFRLPLPERPKNKLLSIHESVLNFTGTEIGKLYPEMISNYSGYASALYEVGYLHAFCLPSSCDVNDLTKSLGKAIEGTYLIVNNTIDCEERPLDRPEPWRNSQILSLFLMAALFSNAFLATLAFYLLDRPKPKLAPLSAEKRKQLELANSNYHATGADSPLSVARSSPRSGLVQSLVNRTLKSRFYADCFSIQKNFERLTKPDPRGLTFVHYTRLVAMALTVITHTGALGTLQAITKPADASNSEQIFRDLIPQMLANAFSSIQIFFFMAGFMLVISTFPSIVRDKGHVSFLEYAIKRAIRLMPGVAATICLNFLWPLVVDGPMLKYFIRMIVVPCEINWWHTMAFVSNFDHVEKMCLRHSYFSASDYQLHIIAFPILILLYKQPTLALALATLLTVSGFVAQVIMILTKTVLPFMMVDYIDKEAFFNVVHYIHHPVWNHMSAFFYGFIVGYLVVKQIRFKLSPRTIKCLWYFLMPAGILSIFAPYFWNHYKRPIYRWQMVLYVIFDRSILLTTCAWLSYASMVLARKPRPAQQQQQQQQRQQQVTSAPPAPAKKAGAELATFEQAGRPMITINLEAGGFAQSDPPAGLPRQRSSPNLANLGQQQQQSASNSAEVTAPSSAPRRLSKTMSSSNLETIAEAGARGAESNLPAGGGQPAQQPQQQQQQQQQQPQRKRSPAPVSNINTLCLMLSRLTFQLYLFNMVVLWVDVNHSKYYWFFSYYFIVFKGAAVYICSAIMAMIFFVVLESPCLTLYIAWVKSRAAGRAKQQHLKTNMAAEAPRQQDSMVGGGDASIGSKQSTTMNKLGAFQVGTLGGMGSVGADKPTFSYIDLSSSIGSNSEPAQKEGERSRRRKDGEIDQTRM